MARRKSLSEWKFQLGGDKELYLQAKEMKKRGISDAVTRLLGYYGSNYRESLRGYKKALKQSSEKKIKGVI
jgi:hypothetical protein